MLKFHPIKPPPYGFPQARDEAMKGVQNQCFNPIIASMSRKAATMMSLNVLPSSGKVQVDSK